MKILNRKLLDEFVNKHADAKNVLQHWIDTVEDAKWKSHNELMLNYPSIDYVENGRYVFNNCKTIQWQRL